MNQQALLWELVKNNNCHLMKRNNMILTSDPSNPQGVQRKSLCGMIQNDSVCIGAEKTDSKKKNVVHFKLNVTKQRKFQAKNRKRSQQHHSVALNVHSVHNAAKIVKSINKYSNLQRTQISINKIAKLHKATVKA